MTARIALFQAVISQVPARILENLRRDPARARRILLRSIWIALAVTAVITAVFLALALAWPLSTSDRLVAIGDVLVGATLFLAAVAAVVAVLAYAVSTGPPDLQVSVQFFFSSANNPEFKAGRQRDEEIWATQFKQLTGSIQLRNGSSYSAKNPAVIIRLRDMAFLRQEGDSDNWAVIDFASTNGILTVQWDGGPNYSIHGNSTRKLPNLELDRLHTYTGATAPALEFEILADGYRKVVVLPVEFTVDGVSQFWGEGWQENPEWM